MSGNIHDTNVSSIKTDVDKMINEIKSIIDRGESPKDYEYTLAKKYKSLHNTSKTLFQFILKNYGTNRFNQQFFDKTLELMLSQITKIQNSNTNQYDASANVGKHLASTFIPQIE